MADCCAAHEVHPPRTSAAGAALTVHACATVGSPLERNVLEDTCPRRDEDGPKAVPPFPSSLCRQSLVLNRSPVLMW